MNPTDPAMADAATALAPALHGGPDLSMLALFLQADWVVKGVMITLMLASVVCWAIVIEKLVLFSRLARQVREFAAAGVPGAGPAPGGEGLAARVLRAGAREWREGRDVAESRSEYRYRIEHAMRATIVAQFRRAEPGLPFLATTGAVGPFIGLFGTVWGIMNSFAGIARSNNTSLAVVAPGIAEALFATAIGLVAAIPAVIAYNRLTVRLARLRQEAQGAATELAANLSRRAPGAAQTQAPAAAE